MNSQVILIIAAIATVYIVLGILTRVTYIR
ncbi:multidrug efflux system subunit MdtC [Escherichia coli]|uniref:Multidrug efflux system subunit MdtC n=1 Tax=Escherichia coli TaxID=562 RepID=A0A377B8Z2_ECOLX|nr:multidrug efflux system subunit MdtC [Escherichia coli]